MTKVVIPVPCAMATLTTGKMDIIESGLNGRFENNRKNNNRSNQKMTSPIDYKARVLEK